MIRDYSKMIFHIPSDIKLTIKSDGQGNIHLTTKVKKQSIAGASSTTTSVVASTDVDSFDNLDEVESSTSLESPTSLDSPTSGDTIISALGHKSRRRVDNLGHLKTKTSFKGPNGAKFSSNYCGPPPIEAFPEAVGIAIPVPTAVPVPVPVATPVPVAVPSYIPTASYGFSAYPAASFASPSFASPSFASPSFASPSFASPSFGFGAGLGC